VSDISAATVPRDAGAGPAALGRGVVVLAGGEPPASWACAPVVVVGEDELADPAPAVEALHAAWLSRTPVVVALAVDPQRFRQPQQWPGEPWRAGVTFEPWGDRLHFLVWANNYDARGDRCAAPVWWWSAKALRLGAKPCPPHVPGDVLLPEGAPAWVDGGPRGPLAVPIDGAAVVHSETLDAGSLRPQPAPVAPSATLAPDQLAAVAHGAGPARVIAPAGSGKTRVLTERLRHLLADRGYEAGNTLAVAYNRKAAEEMTARLPGLGARIQTLNAWGYELVARWLGRRPTVLDESAVRSIVERLVPRQRRRVNTDPIAPYLEGLSLIRLGLRDPLDVEACIDDVTGLAAAYEPYRAVLRERGVIDFDEQVYLALEALLSDGAFRRAVQAEHRHLLVDELQDLTPAHVLLVRLVSCPGYDVFGVGDDDQTIYGHAGADPRFLIDYHECFPGARHHALGVNYRCPAAVTTAASRLLSYNHRRVEKVIRPGPHVVADPEALQVRLHPSDAGASTLVEVVSSWSDEAGADPAEVAVLARVQSLLLGPHVALSEAGVPIDSILDQRVLARLGVRAALAWLRLSLEPDRLSGADLVEVHRRPSRGLPQWSTKWLARCRSLADLERAAARIDDDRVADRLHDLAADLAHLGNLAARGATTRRLLLAIRDQVGLGSAMTLLDSSGGTGGSHLDDLEALLQVADLHPDAATFETWLRRSLHGERSPGAVTLSTVHRVKGREWDRVALFGATAGILPHRLADDVEEERRVLHVAVTRGRREVVVLGDRDRTSPLLAELAGTAPRTQAAAILAAGRATELPAAPQGGRRPARADLRLSDGRLHRPIA
jgi:DNA helicase-2/ATP-dependent DNA helicase PcrA